MSICLDSGAFTTTQGIFFPLSVALFGIVCSRFHCITLRRITLKHGEL